MRKFILIGTMLLASTAIHAVGHAETARGLVMASAETDGPSQTGERSPKKLTVSEQLDAIGEKPAKPQTPPVAAQPAATPAANPPVSSDAATGLGSKTDAKPAAQSKPAGDIAAAKPSESRAAQTSSRRSDKPRAERPHDRDWTERRVSTELARYGIYY